MPSNPKKQTREEKLRSALRGNLKKRKAQARKIAVDGDEKSVLLREREVVLPKKDEEQS